MTVDEIQDRFSHHPPSEKGAQKHKRLAQEFIILAEAIQSICPDGREKALVMTKLEEAKMWASAAVARNPETR